MISLNMTMVALGLDTGDHLEDEITQELFEEIYAAITFVMLIWVSGKFAKLLQLPALVGEIICGIVCGPHVLNYVPLPSAWVLMGDMGLVLLVLEAGIDVDAHMLLQIGFRAVIIAVLGSLLPLSIGTAIGVLLGFDRRVAFCIGACFAPTSMGISLSILRSGGVLSLPVGQLIIAAAILDDVIALVLLAELKALEDPSLWAFLQPLLVAVALLVGIGSVSFFVVPKYLDKVLLRVPEAYRDKAVLGIVMVVGVALVPLCHYAGSSHLLGAFLAGLMVCSNPGVHIQWKHQAKRVSAWLLKVFFACTIGFAVPVQEFGSTAVVLRACIFMTPVLGKVLMGFFAGRPYCAPSYDFLVVGMAMAAWGEFAFILAKDSRQVGLLDAETYASIVLAVLMSAVIAPFFLRLVLLKRQKGLHAGHASTALHTGLGCWFVVQTRSKMGCGLQSRLLKTLIHMDCDLIDLRLSPVYPDEPADTSVHSSAVVAELYIRDRTISIPSLTKNGVLSESVHKILQNRHLKLHHAFIMALEGGDPYVLIHNWFPYEDQRQRLQGSKETQHLEVFLNARRIQGLTKRLVSQAEQVSAPVGAERSLSASEGPSNPANRKRRYSTGMAKDLTLSVPNGPDGFVKSPSASSFTGRSDDAILPVASVPAGVGRVISPIEINVTETGSFTSTMSKTLPEQAMELADTLSSIYFAHFELHALDGMSGYDTPRSKARYRPESEQTSEARADLDIADPVPPGETATPVGESSSTGTFFSLKKFAKVAHSDSVGAVEATQLKQNLLSPERTSDYGSSPSDHGA